MEIIEQNLAFIILMVSGCFVLSASATFVYIKISTNLGLLSKPHKGGVRQDIVPTSGGIAFSLVFFLLIIIYDQFYVIPIGYKLSILIGVMFMTVIGFVDDIYGLSSTFRLISQFLFISLIGYLFNIHLWFFNDFKIMEALIIIIFIPALIWHINTFNFVDGADGLVAVNSILYAATSGFIFFLTNNFTMASLLWMLSAINLGFLIFNWSPAKVFMGDSGSLFLGSIFAVFIVGSVSENQINIWTWATLFSVFYVETTVTLIVRLWRRENAFKDHHSLHAYQQLIINTGIHSLPAKISIYINMLWSIPLSIYCFLYQDYGFVIFFVACIPLSILFYLFGPNNTRKNSMT